MKRIGVLVVLLAGVMCLAACAMPTPTPTTTASDVTLKPEPVAFEVCGEAPAWTRPSEAEQKAKWWDNPRYASADQQFVQHPWTHDFLVVYGNASGEYDAANLSGLWTLAGDERAKCLEPAAQDALLRLQKAEVWVLLHRVQSVQRIDTHYYVTVEPVDKGVQFVQFARPEQQVPLTLHFLDAGGREIETLVEADSLYWPYPQLIPTRKP